VLYHLVIGVVHAVKAYGQNGLLTKRYKTACKVVNFGVALKLGGQRLQLLTRELLQNWVENYVTSLPVKIQCDTFKARVMHYLKLELLELMVASQVTHLLLVLFEQQTNSINLTFYINAQKADFESKTVRYKSATMLPTWINMRQVTLQRHACMIASRPVILDTLADCKRADNKLETIKLGKEEMNIKKVENEREPDA
jgi:hypothetical protein